MKLREVIQSPAVRVASLVFTCFLLGSTGWLSWLYRIMGLADPALVDLYTMVVGYLAQVAGIGAFMLAARRLDGKAQRRVAVASLIAYVVLLEPATMTGELAPTLAFGWAMNVFCGIAQGFYLSRLAERVASGRRGTVFGGGYAASTLATWALSSIAGGMLATGLPCLAACAVMTVIAIALIATMPDASERDVTEAGGASANEQSAESSASSTRPARKIVILAAVAVVLVSLVKNAGFSFPTADLSNTVDLELSRLFYGIGLLAAGIVADRDRRYALACCGISLAVPFIMLALAGAGSSSVVLWAIGYLLFGFFTVFRILLFADLAAQGGSWWLAGAGLFFGRIGDILGTALYLALGQSPEALILATAVLFIAAALLLILLHQQLFGTGAKPAAQRDVLGEFCAEYGLSTREREVLPLLVGGKTYAEIAAELFVTESTVKYHARNIREKTDCATRVEVADLYARRASR